MNPIQKSLAARRELRLVQNTPPIPAAAGPSGKSKGGKKKDEALARFHQSVEISSHGLSLLRTLHKQVLPFILRRSKEMVARDLPSKTIVDLLCPLSAEQRQLYNAYQDKLRTNDDALEQEYQCVKASVSEDTAGATINLTPSELAAAAALKPEEHSAKNTMDGWGSGEGGLALPAFEEDEHEDEEIKMKEAQAPPKGRVFETLNYLKLLCLHPALVVDPSHRTFRARLLQSSSSSGKMIRLAALLMDSGVVRRDEFNTSLNIDDLLQLDGELMEQAGAGKMEFSEAASDGNEDSEGNLEEEEENAPIEAVSSEKNQGAERKKKTSKTALLATDKESAAMHVSKSLAKELTVPLHRCLIFAQHRAALDLVEEHVLSKYFPSVGYERLDGSMEPLKRSAVARRFNAQRRHGENASMMFVPDDGESGAASRAQQVAQLMTALPAAAGRAGSTSAQNIVDSPVDDDIRLLLMTTRSCGLGLNLTAADTVIFLEHDWNPFADLQAMDRVHRLGQTQPVTVYRLLGACDIRVLFCLLFRPFCLSFTKNNL